MYCFAIFYAASKFVKYAAGRNFIKTWAHFHLSLFRLISVHLGSCIIVKKSCLNWTTFDAYPYARSVCVEGGGGRERAFHPRPPPPPRIGGRWSSSEIINEFHVQKYGIALIFICFYFFMACFLKDNGGRTFPAGDQGLKILFWHHRWITHPKIRNSKFYLFIFFLVQCKQYFLVFDTINQFLIAKLSQTKNLR